VDPNFAKAIHRAILEGHPLATEMFCALVRAYPGRDFWDLHEYTTALALWRHARDLDADEPN
jgi:hypothetical protein